MLDGLRRNFSLPLLVKELAERAARRRTYVLRVIYAGLLFLGFALFAARYLGIGFHSGQSLTSVMGAGRTMFEMLFILQLVGIYLFLPAIMCGAITGEKERDSLSLLLLTELSPWQIVLQKYLGGVIPMIAYTLVALPLGAVAYTYGGVDVEMIGWGAWVLLVTLLQIAALALMCSAKSRTTGEAFIRTYLVGAAFYFIPVIIATFVEEVEVYAARWWGWEYDADDSWGYCFIPMAAVFGLADSSTQSRALLSLPSIVMTAYFLIRARVLLLTFAFRPPLRRITRCFKWLDKKLHGINQKVGGVMLLPDKGDLPKDRPIFWYEVRQKLLSKPHYIFRLGVALEVPVVLLSVFVFTNANARYGSHSEVLSICAGVLGVIAILMLITQATGAFARERTNQTLDVLLTTALSAREMVQEKMAAVWRLAWMFIAALLTLLLTARLVEWQFWSWQTKDIFSLPVRLVCCIATVFVYSALVLWLGMWIGLKVRGRLRAIMTSIGTIAVWCVAPIFIVEVVLPLVFGRQWMAGSYDAGFYELSNLQLLNVFTPVYVPILSEMKERVPPLGRDFQWTLVLLNFGFYGGVSGWLRHLCLTEADNYLRR